MRKLFSIVVVVAITTLICATGCVTNYPAVKRNFQNQQIIEKSYDEVWNKIILHFGANNIPVKTIEKASGFIVAENEFASTVEIAMSFNDNKLKQEFYEKLVSICDCGKIETGGYTWSSVNLVKFSFNIVV